MKKITMGTYQCTEEDIESVTKTLRSNYLSTGSELKKLENRVANLCGKKYGLMVNSGQSALEVALILAKVHLGKNKLRVAIPATTYAATLWAIINTGNEPVFVDIGDDYNIDCNNLENDLDVDAILAVDLCGKVADIPEWVKRKYFVIEDACEAFGNPKCTYGDIICFSFYVSHIVTCGSGGIVCLNNKELYKYAESYIAHGRVYGGDFTSYTDKWVDKFLFDKVGVSYRSSNINAALVWSQLDRLSDILSKRKENAKILIDLYQKSNILKANFIFPDYNYHENCVFQFFPIVIKSSLLFPPIHSLEKGKRIPFCKEELLQYLFENKIDSRVLLSLTNQPIIKRLYGDIEQKFTKACFCNKNGFIVGCHQNLDRSDMIYIIEILEKYIKENYEKD